MSRPRWSNGGLHPEYSKLTRARLHPDGPYDNLQIGVAVTDPDGVRAAGRNMDPTTTTDCVAAANCTGVAWPRPRIRFGRLKLTNAHGSELLNLPVPVETQYWNGAVFVTNTADSCTSLSAANVTLTKARPPAPRTICAISSWRRASQPDPDASPTRCAGPT